MCYKKAYSCTISSYWTQNSKYTVAFWGFEVHDEEAKENDPSDLTGEVDRGIMYNTACTASFVIQFHNPLIFQ